MATIETSKAALQGEIERLWPRVGYNLWNHQGLRFLSLKLSSGTLEVQGRTWTQVLEAAKQEVRRRKKLGGRP